MPPSKLDAREGAQEFSPRSRFGPCGLDVSRLQPKGTLRHIAIDELCAIVYPRDGHHKLLGFLECYLDESGTHGSAEVCTVAGYIGGKGQLRKFDELWNGALDEFQVTDFHAKDFWARDNKGNRVAPYAGWDDAKSERLLARLVLAINTYRIYPVSCTIFNQEFFKCNERLRRYLTGGQVRNAKFVTTGCPSRPYYLAFSLSVTTAASFLPVGPNWMIHYFCGLDRILSGYANDFFRQIKEHPSTKRRESLGVISFPYASHTPVLQAADLLAYAMYQHGLNKLSDWNSEPSDLLKGCLQRTRSLDDHKYLNQEGLETIVSEMRPALRGWLLSG